MTTNSSASALPQVVALSFEDVTLDLRREVLLRNGDEVRLRPRTFGVLTHLLANAGRVVSKQELMDVVWADVVVTEDSLVQCLIEIRRALGPAQRVITTVRGRGYLVDCHVRHIGPSATDAVPLQVTPHADPESPTGAFLPSLAAAGGAARQRSLRSAMVAIAVGVCVAAGAGTLGWLWGTRGDGWPRPGERRTATIRFTVAPPSGHVFGNGHGPANAAPNVETTTLAVSPDGTRLAMVATDVSGHTRIWLRSLDALDPVPVPSTEGATSVFWSPDGRSLGFPAQGTLKRLDLASGTAVALCDLPAHPGGVYGTWGADSILFSAGTQLLSVSVRGGTPVSAVQLAPDEDGAKWPWFLPDGRRFLYMARLPDRGGRVKLAAPGHQPVTVLAAASNVQWVDPGYLVFVRDGSIVAQRFDPDTGRVTGELRPLATPVLYSRSTTRAAFSVSRSGVLVYLPGGDSSRLTWTRPDGASDDVVATGDLMNIRLSPDGRRALFSRAAPGLGTYDLWALDLGRRVEWRLTSEPTSEIGGQWLPDGGGIVFSAERQGPPRLFFRRAQEDQDRALRPPGTFTVAHDVAPDGLIAFRVVSEPKPRVVWGMVASGAEPVPLMAPRFDIEELRFSPDGDLVALVASDSGRAEVYVAPRGAPQQRVRLSVGGGRAPRWGRKGDLFYLSQDGRLMTARIAAGARVSPSSPHALFTIPSPRPWIDYDVAPDGRFLAIVPEIIAHERPVIVMLDWLLEE